MKLTTRGRYAVTAMLDLAINGGSRPVSLADISGRQEISLSYLEQLFAKLRREQLVTSARERRIPWPVQDARRCAERIVQHADAERVAILFGREDRGLLNEELQRCNLHCHIPTHEGYPSLNLAMAVQIIAYECRMMQLDGQTALPEDAEWDAPFATAEDMTRFYAHLEETLIDIEFLNPEAPRQLMRRLKRLYNRVRLDEMELNILRGILTETQKKASRSAD